MESQGQGQGIEMHYSNDRRLQNLVKKIQVILLLLLWFEYLSGFCVFLQLDYGKATVDYSNATYSMIF